MVGKMAPAWPPSSPQQGDQAFDRPGIARQAERHGKMPLPGDEEVSGRNPPAAGKGRPARIGRDGIGRTQGHDDVVGIDAGFTHGRGQRQPLGDLVARPAHAGERLCRTETGGETAIPGDFIKPVGGGDEERRIRPRLGRPGRGVGDRKLRAERRQQRNKTEA